MSSPEKKPRKKDRSLESVLINVVVPVIVLTMLSKEKYLGPTWGLVAALILPVGYGVHSMIRDRKIEFMSVLGVVSVLLTGVFGLLKLPPEWIAWKEAMIPFLLGVAIVGSLKTPFPLIKKILMTESLFDVHRLKSALKERGNEALFEKRLVGLTWGLASSLFLSAVLNFVLAKLVLKSEPGTEAYTAEIGRMTGLGYVVVMIPSMAIMLVVFNALINTLVKLTGLDFESLLAEHLRKPPPEKADETTAD